MGRRPLGRRHAERLDCDEEVRARLDWVLATLGGEATIDEACGALGISESRFHQIRNRALAGAAAALVPGRPGRPPKEEPVDAGDLTDLRAKVVALEQDLVIERARTELARGLPHLLRDRGRGEKRERPGDSVATDPVPRRGGKQRGHKRHKGKPGPVRPPDS